MKCASCDEPFEPTNAKQIYCKFPACRADRQKARSERHLVKTYKYRRAPDDYKAGRRS